MGEFNPSHIQVLSSILDTFCPSLCDKEQEKLEFILEKKRLPTSSLNERKPFYDFSPSKNEKIAEICLEYIENGLPVDKIPIIKLVLSALSTTPGTFLLTGHLAPFPSLSRPDRESALLTLSASYFNDLKVLFKAIIALSSVHAYGLPNETWDALGYKLDSLDAMRQQGQEAWRPTLLNLDQSKVFSFLECDIVIVGSGCGGGLMAAELSKAGYRVILCEKAAYSHPSDYIMNEREGLFNTYEQRAAFQSEDGAMQVLAGSCWGGGSAVNWSASFQPPAHLREEWKKEYGVDFVTTPQFQTGVETIWKRQGVDTCGIKHNVPNQILLDGCAKLGLKADAVAQNTSGKSHECGVCTFGCPSGTKNSSSLTWIKDAAEHGCQFIDKIYVDRIVHTNRVAKGVEGTRNGKKVVIKANKCVVVSGGSLNTPALLLRSNIPKLNTHVGKHLRLHPVATVNGIFYDRIVKPHEGSILTTVHDFKDAQGYGYKLEVPTSVPGLFAAMQKWTSGFEHKKQMMMWQNTSTIIVLTRDKDSEGVIRIDGAGKPRLDWALGQKDEKTLVDGMIQGLKVLLAAGADEVYSGQVEVESFKRDPKLSLQETLDSKEFKAFTRAVKAAGVKPNKCSIFSAHQMGSCRMHKDPSKGAVSPRGNLHGMSKLYVSDASVFPTASGVNPMMTVYSMAYQIAQTIKQDLSTAKL